MGQLRFGDLLGKRDAGLSFGQRGGGGGVVCCVLGVGVGFLFGKN